MLPPEKVSLSCCCRRRALQILPPVCPPAHSHVAHLTHSLNRSTSQEQEFLESPGNSCTTNQKRTRTEPAEARTEPELNQNKYNSRYDPNLNRAWNKPNTSCNPVAQAPRSHQMLPFLSMILIPIMMPELIRNPHPKCMTSSVTSYSEDAFPTTQISNT